jgi:DNA-binding NarL/FixJ family response regulator
MMGPIARKTFHVLIVEDNPTMRLMVRSMLERDDRISVAAEAFNGIDAVGLVERLCPDAVIIGVQMPFMDGVTAARLIKRVCPTTAVIMFSAVMAPALMQQALDAGADLYLSKTTPPSELSDAVVRVCREGIRLSHAG